MPTKTYARDAGAPAMTSTPLVFQDPPAPLEPLRAAIVDNWRVDEAARVETLIAEAELGAEAAARVEATAMRLVEAVRREAREEGGLDAFMHEYDLSSREGIALMCLAEALLRIPDAETADRLIADKLLDAHWDQHLGQSDSLFVNASTW